MLSVVIAGRQDDEFLFIDQVNEAVRFVDPARPAAAQTVLQGFRLADAGKRITLRIFDQIIDASERLAILRLPPDITIPGFSREFQTAHPVPLLSLRALVPGQPGPGRATLPSVRRSPAS